MSNTRYYDKANKRLVFIESGVGVEFWDDKWEKLASTFVYKKKISSFNYVVNITRKYLPAGSLILEGGAALADSSWYLHLAGYKTIAVDYAPRTIEFLKKKVPEVNPLLADVRKLPIESNSIDGYWSLGVIEHFYDGYAEIKKEIQRVIRSDGYLFLNFPMMSLLRRIKAVMGLYPSWQESSDLRSNFYQFALDRAVVVRDFEKSGFVLVASYRINGIKGLKDEVLLLQPVLQYLYDANNLPAKVLRVVVDKLAEFFAAHSAVLVFRKTR